MSAGHRVTKKKKREGAERRPFSFIFENSVIGWAPSLTMFQTMIDPAVASQTAIRAALEKAFPCGGFDVDVVFELGSASATVTWEGGPGLPTPSEVTRVLTPFSRQWGGSATERTSVDSIQLAYADPRLFEDFAHLKPIARGTPASKRLDLALENVRRHLVHLFPGVEFQVSGDLGAFAGDSKVCVCWVEDHEGPLAPTKAQCLEALGVFLVPSQTMYVSSSEVAFHRLFGVFNRVVLVKE